MRKRTIAIDFDGTITDYHVFQGKGIFDPPITGAKWALEKLKEKGCRIIIFTTRHEIGRVREYLEEQEIPFDFINHNPANVELDCSPLKVLADVYIDDRAITFDGHWNDELIEKVMNFQPHYVKND